MALKSITLINPNHCFKSDPTTKMVLPPLGLAYLAAYLEKTGVEVSIVDANVEKLTPIQTARRALTQKPKLVGISAVTNTIKEAWEIAQQIKKKKNIPIVLGGVHPTILPEESLKKNFIDMVIRGEGEIALADLTSGKTKRRIASLSFKKGKKIVHSPQAPLIKNLDTLPFPARHLLPTEKYASIGSKQVPFTTMLSSRGCPYHCSFCSVQATGGPRWRPRSPENVLAEIDHLVKDYGVREINFADDNFTLDPTRVEKICQLLIKRNYDLILKNSNGVRLDSLTYPLLQLMKKAGWYLLAFGIESGNQQILDKNNKELKLTKVRQVVHWCQKIGIDTTGFFIIGLPGETPTTIKKTIDFAKSLDLDEAQFNILIPFVGTRVREIIEKEGKILTNDWHFYNPYAQPVFKMAKLTPSLMLKSQQRAHRQFYLRPKILLKQIQKGHFLGRIKAGLPVMFAQLRK